MSNLKFKIAKIIASSNCFKECPNYEDLLEVIYDNQYRTILKVPTDIFIEGIVNSFVINDVDHANKILNVVKEVITEALEFSGIELTFTDQDWDNMRFFYKPNRLWIKIYS